ncbi:hypothetical protein SteCoe_29655 [Stentor coeruleus]|uniref:HTH CENPB-type domain-containing protein n=1 Tax=Stentor coeruleus TaxID=5963 RepID=A0A1R2B5E4_9CILI|nr:hypothetical protein SteCoe_29655 [Stentor coeruleus]
MDLNLPTKRNIRKRRDVTIKKKLEIINYYEKNQSVSHADIANIFKLNRSTISKILSKKESFLEKKYNTRELNIIRIRSGKYSDIELAIFSWLSLNETKEYKIPYKTIKDKAIEFRDKLLSDINKNEDIERLKDFKASICWAKKFKLRYQSKLDKLCKKEIVIDTSQDEKPNEEFEQNPGQSQPENIDINQQMGFFETISKRNTQKDDDIFVEIKYEADDDIGGGNLYRIDMFRAC